MATIKNDSLRPYPVTWRASVAVLCVATVLTGFADAGPIEDGFAAYSRGDYATALALLLPLANEGSSRRPVQSRRDV